MPWVGPRYKDGVILPVWYDPVVGPPDNSKVPQWPNAHTERIGGKWRWVTEPLRRPYAQRLICKVEYSQNDPANQGGTYDYTEYCWIDRQSVVDFSLFGNPGVSPYGTKLKVNQRLLAGDVTLLPADVDFAFEVETPNDPPVTLRASFVDSLAYNIPQFSLASQPGMATCSVCDPDLPTEISVTVAGSVLVDQGCQKTFDIAGNGTFALSHIQNCAWRYTQDIVDPGCPAFPDDIRHEVTVSLDMGIDQARFVCSVRIYSLSFPQEEIAGGIYLSDWYPTTNGTMDCPSKLPLLLTVGGQQHPKIDMSNASVLIDAPPGVETHRFPYKRITCYGVSECYPFDTLAPPDIWVGEEAMSNELAGVLAYAVPSQSIAGGVFLNLQAPIVEEGGQWWDPLGNANELIVPEPWNFIKARVWVGTGTARVNSITIGMEKAGTFDYPGVLVVTERQSDNAQNTGLSVGHSRWCPVSPGDVLRLYASQTGGGLSSTDERSGIEIQAAYFYPPS